MRGEIIISIVSFRPHEAREVCPVRTSDEADRIGVEIGVTGSTKLSRAGFVARRTLRCVVR